MFRFFIKKNLFDVAILHPGANDSRGGVSAVDFKKQTEEVIAMLRKWMGDPDFKGMLPAQPSGWNLTSIPGRSPIGRG